MFERTLQDVVRGLRSQPTSEGRNQFASTVLQECRKEAKSTDGAIKSQAVLKIAHLRMLGYDKQNAGDDDTSFHVIETMAQPIFRYKRIGYLAASQLLTSRSPVLLLATNSLKKELQANDVYIVGLALGSCSSFISKEMARDLLQDVITVTNSSTKAYVRKRGTLCLYKMCVKYPEAINMGAFDALRTRLDDTDSSVVSCAVNAICELAKVNPRNVLPLTPQLYSLLTTSGNNWLTIKVVKLYASLLRVEPRLGKKLLEPLAHIVQTTPAKSLLFEAVATIIMALSVIPETSVDQEKRNKICQLCAKKLKEFVNDADQNLKYLGLTGFIELTKAATPAIASCLETKEIILCCLNDDDSTVRLKALELLSSMSTKQTVNGIVQRLLEFLPKAEDKDAIVRCVILACVDEDYSRVPSCEWLLAVFLDLARLGAGAQAALLAKQIVTLALRVPSVRDFASKACAKLVMERKTLVVESSEILRACAFVCSEYDCEENDNAALVQDLLQFSPEKEEGDAATTMQCAFVTSAFKLAKRRGLLPSALARADALLSMPALSFRTRDRLLWFKAQGDGLRESRQQASGEKAAVERFGPVHERAQRHVAKPSAEHFAPKRLRTSPKFATKRVSFRGRVEPVYEMSSTVAPPQPISGFGPAFVSHNLPYYAPKATSSSSSAFVPSSVTNRAAQDIAPFILKSSTTAESFSPRHRTAAGSYSDYSSEGGGYSPKTQSSRLASTPPPPLWSTTLGSAMMNNHSSPVVILSTAPPPSFSANLAQEEEEERRKKRSGGEITLADVELRDFDSNDQAASAAAAVASAEAKPKTKKKSKDKKKKKSKQTGDALAPVGEEDLEPDMMGFAVL